MVIYMREKMKIFHVFPLLTLFIGFLSGCAIAPVVQENALPTMPFSELIAHADQYRGKAVILGGYVLEVENAEAYSRISAVQAPLGFGQHVKSKDLSEGRLILIYDGFIDPEVYTKDRQITVAGNILEGADNDPELHFPFLKLKVNSIHLWSEEKPPLRDPFWEDVWFYPHPWYWGYPFTGTIHREPKRLPADRICSPPDNRPQKSAH